MITSYEETLTKFRKILDVQDDDLFVMLEEGRLAGALIRTLMKKGMRDAQHEKFCRKGSEDVKEGRHRAG